MPCSCFGKKDKKCGVAAEEKYRPRDSNSREREPPSVAAPSQAPPPAATPPPPLTPTAGGDARLRPEDDPDKANRRRDVVASFYSDQCELIGFKATGSRPPSTHVGSTVDGPAATSSPAASSPGSTRSAASCRAELAEKRREFFKQLTLEDDNSSCGGGSRPISRLTDPGCHTTPRHSHYQDHLHHSLPHPPKPTPRAFKYSLPLTPPPASEETQPLLQPTNQEDPQVDEGLTGSSEAPQVPAGASEPPGQGWGVVEAPACVVQPPQDIPQQTHRPGLSSSISADQSSSEVAREPLLQQSAETLHLGEESPEQRQWEPLTGGRSQELIRVSSPTDLSQLLANVSHPVIEDMPTDDNSQVLVSVSATVVEDSSTSDSSQVVVSVPSSVKTESVILNSSEAVISEHLAEGGADAVNTAAADIVNTAAAPADTVNTAAAAADTVNTAAAADTVNTAADTVNTAAAAADTVNTAAAAADTVNTAAAAADTVNTAADTVNTAAADTVNTAAAAAAAADTVNTAAAAAAAADTVNTAAAAADTVNTAAAEQSQLCVEEQHYVHQTSVQSDDERVAEGSCILIDDAFPPQPQEAAAAAAQGNNHTTSSPPHLLRHNSLGVQDEHSQESHISTTPQELPLASTDEGYDEVSRQSALHSDFLDNSQHDTELMVPEAAVRLEFEEVVLNNHQEPVHQALSLTVDPYFLTSAEEPEELQIDQMLHQSGSQLEEKHLAKQRPQLPEVSVQHYSQAKSTVEIVECIAKVPPPPESTVPLRAASSHLNTVEAALTATTLQDEVEPLPPAPPTPPFEDEPLPPPPPTPPLLDEPLPPAPPTPPISSERRLPPATCGTHLSSSVLEDDGLGSEIDDALSSLECLSEEGNRNERAAAS